MSAERVEIGYGYGRAVALPFDRTVERAREELKKAGFGVLCEIDMQQKLKERLGVEIRRYLILGACNPPIAYRTLQRELHIGLLLPCNLIVYEDGERSVAAAIDAGRMMTIVGNPELEREAGEVNALLRGVIDAI